MTRNGGGAEWTKPSVILTILSFISMALGAFLALQRDSADAMLEMDRRVTRIETRGERRDEQIKALEIRAERIEDRERGRR